MGYSFSIRLLKWGIDLGRQWKDKLTNYIAMMKKQIKPIQKISGKGFFSKGFAFVTAALILLASCNKNEDELIDHLASGTNSTKGIGASSNGSTIGSKIDEANLAFVEGGSFMMGSPAGTGEGDERPQHKVTLSSYKISKYEITNEQFAAFLTAKGNQQENGVKWYQGSDISQQGKTFTPKKGREKFPVVFVTWNGANAYAKWVGGRIPTEAEWEFAARGGNKSKGYTYSGSNNINDVGWYVGNSGGRLHAVGEKKANELGIHDMSGNIWEWTADWYGSYTKDAKTNPKGAASGANRVRRGASAFCTMANTRSANRSNRTPDGVRHNLGFRVVFDIK